MVDDPKDPAGSGPSWTSGDQNYQPPKIRHEDTADPEARQEEPAAAAQEAAPSETATDEAAGRAAEELVVDSHTAIEECLHAHRRGRRIIMVVGLPTTGKSFFIKRLMNVLNYSRETLDGAAESGDQIIDRTKGVLLTKFEAHDGGRWFDRNSRRSPRNFDIYDVPGDYFAAMVRQSFTAKGDPEMARVIYALCAFADAFVFVAPALQVLTPDVFRTEGDGLLLAASDRETRVQETGRFIGSINAMSRAIAVLRDRVERNMRKARKDPRVIEAAKAGAKAAREAVVHQKPRVRDLIRRDAAIQAIDEVLPFKNSEFQKYETTVSRLPHPALILLSRGDELRAKMVRSRETFDADPCLALAAKNDKLLKETSAWFATVAVDFMTAQDGHIPGQEFKKDGVSYGVEGLIEEWVLPAINHARRPGILRWLQSARTAMWVRRVVDPDFARVWKA